MKTVSGKDKQITANCNAASNFLRRTLFIIFLLFPLISSFAIAEQEKYILSIENEAGKEILALPMVPPYVFAIRYIHSVAQTPVMDFFVIKDGQIYLDKTVYQDFGAGLPHNPEKGQKMELKHGELIISGYDQPLPDLQMRVGIVAQHKLLFFKNENNKEVIKEIPLSKIAAPGSAIKFIIKTQK